MKSREDNLDLDELFAEIDNLSAERIGLMEYLKLIIRMVGLLRKAKKF